MYLPRTLRAVFHGDSPFYPVPARRRAFFIGENLVLVDFQSEWFKLYCKAVLQGEPQAARVLIENAVSSIDERLCLPDLSNEEREAMLAAVRYLSLISQTELPKAS